jgi:hypothetical protein
MHFQEHIKPTGQIGPTKVSQLAKDAQAEEPQSE